MRRIAHISDLHFGRFDPDVRAGLLNHLIELKPHMVIVSGDLTQRAKKEEFLEAKAFLQQLANAGIPYFAIPGNHDLVPFHRPLSRIFRPLSRYKKYFDAETQFFAADEEIAIAGINTARAAQIENGRVTRKQIEEVRAWFSKQPKQLVKIVVTHHPLFRNGLKKMRTPAWRWWRSIDKLHEVGVDIYVSGHLHRSAFTRRGALIVQGGTVSSRLRGEAPTFNLLTVKIPHLTVERFRWDDATRTFSIKKPEVLLIKNKRVAEH